MIPIILTYLTLFGNMIYGQGLAALVDGYTNNVYNTTTQGYAGVVFTEPTNILLAEIDSQTNGFDASGAETTITLRLYGRTSGTPAHATDGTLLGSTTFADVNELRTKQIIPNDTSTEYHCAWWVIDTGVWAAATEMQFFTDDGGGTTSTPTPTATPTPTPTPSATPSITDVSGGAILRRSLNEVTPLLRYGGELEGYRARFYLAQASPALILYQTNLVHRGEYTGYYGVVGVGLNICYRYSETALGLDTAETSCPPNSVSGTNIINRDPAHYGSIVIMDAWVLEAGYYEVFVTGSAHSTGSTADGLAAILSEYGRGLNRLVVWVYPAGVVIGD